MKDLLLSILGQLKNANGPTRAVIGAGVALLLVVAGVVSFRAQNPSFVLLYSGLDDSQLTAVQAAIANGDIRFKTSAPPAPYSVWVEESRQYEALSQVAMESALQADPRGISGTSGMESVWRSADEREQVILKKRWQEVELQLESFPWIGRAKVTSSTPPRGILAYSEHEPLTVSAVLQLVGTSELPRGRSDTVVQIISFAFGVPPENVIVSDQNGQRLFDPSRSSPADDLLAHQEEFDRTRTGRVQAALDRAYGPGMTIASVHGEWSYEEVETVEQSVDPTSKAPVSEFISETETPSGTSVTGGPVGVAADAEEASSSVTAESLATTSESSKEYEISRNTNLRRKTAPVLERLSVSVVVDRSLESELTQVEEATKGFAGFDQERDTFSSMVATFPGFERDDEGLPVPAEAVPAEEPMSPTVTLLLERAVEIVAALAFLLILFRSLKRGSPAPPEPSQEVAASPSGDSAAEEYIDLDMLARAHVQELLESDPERVSTLLSRWALSDSVYSRGMK